MLLAQLLVNSNKIRQQGEARHYNHGHLGSFTRKLQFCSPGNHQSIPCRPIGEEIEEKGRWEHVQWGQSDGGETKLAWESMDWQGDGPHPKLNLSSWLTFPKSSLHLVAPYFLLLLTQTCLSIQVFVLPSQEAFSSLMAHGCADPTHTGLNLGTQAKLARCRTGLEFNTEQKSWSVALIIVLLKTRLDFFHSRMKKYGILKGNPTTFRSSIKLSMKSHPPRRASGNSYPQRYPKNFNSTDNKTICKFLSRGI